MKRWIPYPILTVALFLMWLLLTQSFSPGQILLGIGAAMLGSRAAAAMQLERPRPGSIRAIAKLLGIVAMDIVRSNFAVASIILLPRKERVSGFVRLPLDLQSRYGLAALALIITATPGTIWVQYDRGSRILLVHILDLVDEETWIRLIKGRYETLLLEIFG